MKRDSDDQDIAEINMTQPLTRKQITRISDDEDIKEILFSPKKESQLVNPKAQQPSSKPSDQFLKDPRDS
jgi:hypothetical protein